MPAACGHRCGCQSFVEFGNHQEEDRVPLAASAAKAATGALTGASKNGCVIGSIVTYSWRIGPAAVGLTSAISHPSVADRAKARRRNRASPRAFWTPAHVAIGATSQRSDACWTTATGVVCSRPVRRRVTIKRKG